MLTRRVGAESPQKPSSRLSLLLREVLRGPYPLVGVVGREERPGPLRLARVSGGLHQGVLGWGVLSRADPVHEVQQRILIGTRREAPHRAITLGYGDRL